MSFGFVLDEKRNSDIVYVWDNRNDKTFNNFLFELSKITRTSSLLKIILYEELYDSNIAIISWIERLGCSFDRSKRSCMFLSNLYFGNLNAFFINTGVNNVEIIVSRTVIVRN